MRNWVFFFCICLIIGCTGNDVNKDKYNVGEIPFDPIKDDRNFKLCNENQIKQYYARNTPDNPAGYKGEKIALITHFANECKLPKMKGQDGYLTFRFIVNCEGEMGRYRVDEMDLDYQPKQFNKQIVFTLHAAIKKLDGWIPVNYKGKDYDFYQYLTFKLVDGRLKEIMP
ncbi:MAG: hypothetical protein AAF502_09625 [Bacteroidota bacterium]